MKGIFSLGIISAVLFGTMSPLVAQSARQVKSSKVKAPEASNRFGSVRAVSDGNGVLVEWQMALEKNNAGFEVYRLDGRRSARVTESLIPGSAILSTEKVVAGEKYSFFDPDGSGASVYYVRSYELNGKAETSQTVAVETLYDMQAYKGVSSDDLQRQVVEAKQNGKVTTAELSYPKPLGQEVYANRPSADATTHAWVVAQPGVRIGVRRDGLFRVTKAELQNAGFNVNGDSNLWQLYREGVEQAIILGPNADYIDFYGKGKDTPETDMSVYFLVSGPSAGKRMAVRTARPYGGTVTSPNYAQVFVQKQRTNYIQQVINGEAENYFGALITTGGNTTYNFTLTGVDFNAPQAQLELKFHGFSFTPHIILVTLNGETLASASGNSQSPFSANYTIPTSHLREGNNSLVFRAGGTTFDSSLFDTVSIAFARKQLAAQDGLRFYTDNYRLAKLTGFTSSNVRLFDMTNESEPVLWTNLSVIPENGSFSVRMPADRGRSMYAVADPGIQTAVSITPNDPAVLRSPSNAANLVIITHKNWLTEAEAWANYRRGQGVTVKVVEVSEVFDEFSYGDFSSLSLKNFLHYAKTNWQTPPSYVLLLGDGSFDFRNYQGLGYHNYVPAHIVNTVFLETASDDSLADFNGDGLAEMAVGRITARTGQTVTNALAKVTAWEAALPTLQGRGVLFASDEFDADNNYDFEQISIRLRNQLPGNVPSTMIAKDDVPAPPDTPTSLLVSSMNTGKFFVNYTGHGSTGSWSQTFFTNNNIPQLTNASNQSIFIMLTCLNGFFHHVSNRSLAESLVEATNGGAVAAWASTGETTPDVQEAMATRFFLKAGEGQIARLGDLANDAKSIIPGGTDVRLSWALIGDPMLRIHNP